MATGPPPPLKYKRPLRTPRNRAAVKLPHPDLLKPAQFGPQPLPGEIHHLDPEPALESPAGIVAPAPAVRKVDHVIPGRNSRTIRPYVSSDERLGLWGIVVSIEQAGVFAFGPEVGLMLPGSLDEQITERSRLVDRGRLPEIYLVLAKLTNEDPACDIVETPRPKFTLGWKGEVLG